MVNNRALINVACAMLCVVFMTSQAHSQDAENEEALVTPVKTAAWAPPQPNPTEFDWVKMKTGEWLKGELTGLRDRRVRFDSDEFDNVEFDWHKVESLYLPKLHSYKVGRQVLFGSAEMRGSVMRIRTAKGIVDVDRKDLESITPGGDAELSLWSGELTANYTNQSGNTQQTDIGGQFHIRREAAITRLLGDYRGTYETQNNEKTENNHRGNLGLDIFLTRYFFVTVPTIEYFRDEFQNIDDRISPGLAAGYEILKNPAAEWDVSLGGAYQYTKFNTGTKDDDFAVVFTSSLDYDITGDIEFESVYKMQFVTTDTDKTSHFWESKLSFEIWGPLDLDLGFTWERIEGPEEDDAGDAPKSNDYKTWVGLTLEF